MRNFFFLLFYGLLAPALAQIRVEVSLAPSIAEPETRIFLASSFNNWVPGDPKYELTRQPDGTYFIVIADTLRYFEYKFTQGYWTYVEGSAVGGSRPNRIYNRSADATPNQITALIEGWERKPTYRFIVKDIPENTPQDATLYITGNFNNWTTNDENYRLQKQVDGTYQIPIMTDLERLEFKFTRGTWESVEGQASGKARPNRVLLRKSDLDKLDAIELEIESWEDLSGTFNYYSIYDLLLLFSAFQSILLIIAISSLQDYNRRANRWLIIALGFTGLMVFVRVVSDYSAVAQQYTKLLFLPDFVLLLYAPLFYFYIRKLLFKGSKLPPRWWIHFLPAIGQFFLYLPFFLMDSKALQHKIVNREADLVTIWLVVGTLAWFYNLYYWFICRRSIRRYQREFATHASYEQNIQYLSTVVVIQGVCLSLWAFTGILLGSSYVFELQVAGLVAKSVDTIWLAFSSIPYFLGYFAIHQPEVFKLPTEEAAFFSNVPAVAEPDKQTALKEDHDPDRAEHAEENLLPFKEKIDAYMQKHKPYTNAGLTLNELAGKLKMSPHLLSKVINDVYEKNFFDFINSYRIEEFKLKFEDPRNKQFTMLALAFEVGFNSKTAFNRAFKKMTNQSPREYFFESRLED